MKPRAFAALTVVTVVALVVAIATYAAQNRWSQVKVSGAGLVPGLAAQASRIAKIELRQGDKALTLTRDKDAGRSPTGEAIRPSPRPCGRCSSSSRGPSWSRARRATRIAMRLLELEDPAAKDAKSRLLRLLDDKGGVIAEAVVGKKRLDAFGGSKSGTYVRKPGDAQTWLANADLDVPVAVRDWVQPGVLDIPAAKIAKVTVEIPGEEPLMIARDAADATKYALVGMPEGKKLKEGAGIDAIVRAAGNIELEDVRKPRPRRRRRCEHRQDRGRRRPGRHAAAAQGGRGHWVSLEATGAEGDAKKTAEDITTRTQGWEFKVPAHKAQSILKRRADLFEAS